MRIGTRSPFHFIDHSQANVTQIRDVADVRILPGQKIEVRFAACEQEIADRQRIAGGRIDRVAVDLESSRVPSDTRVLKEPTGPTVLLTCL